MSLWTLVVIVLLQFCRVVSPPLHHQVNFSYQTCRLRLRCLRRSERTAARWLCCHPNSSYRRRRATLSNHSKLADWAIPRCSCHLDRETNRCQLLAGNSKVSTSSVRFEFATSLGFAWSPLAIQTRSYCCQTKACLF